MACWTQHVGAALVALLFTHMLTVNPNLALQQLE